MVKSSNPKPVYDLEERTFLFAKNLRKLMRKIKKDNYVEDDIRQAIRASGSVGANYIEANESLSKKDFLHRIKICRKEAKESAYWIKLINDCALNGSDEQCSALVKEANELKLIFSAIIEKSMKVLNN